MESLNERMKRIRFIVCDVDGVLTDGSLGFDGEGRPVRTIHARDVTGITLWHLAGGKTALVSGLGSAAAEAIAAQWKCAECHMWIRDKRRVCEEMARRHGMGLDDMAFLGDDLIDVRAMRAVGLAVAPADADPLAKAAAHWVTHAPGGKGALRELVHSILAAQDRLDATLEAYASRQDGVQ